MIDINPSPYQKKSLKTQIRASALENVAITGFHVSDRWNGVSKIKIYENLGTNHGQNQKTGKIIKLKQQLVIINR